MSTSEGEIDALPGPLDNRAFPEFLTARVVSPGRRPRIHGYDVEGDLALNYSAHDILYLSLTGELPDGRVSAALGVVLTFLSPLSAGHAPTHGAMLSHLCGATVTATVGVAAIGLAEHARTIVDEHAELLSWLDAGRAGVPAAYLAAASDFGAVERLGVALDRLGVHAPALDVRPAPMAALLAVLHGLGLRAPEQLVTVMVTARLPVAVAEALSGKPVDFKHYPINLPRFRYEES